MCRGEFKSASMTVSLGCCEVASNLAMYSLVSILLVFILSCFIAVFNSLSSRFFSEEMVSDGQTRCTVFHVRNGDRSQLQTKYDSFRISYLREQLLEGN